MTAWMWVAAAAAGTITDATGASVTASAGVRLVALGGGITEAVVAIGAGQDLVGTDVTSTHPTEALGALPKVGNYRTLAAEGLLSLGPELIVCTDAAGPTVVLDQLRAAGVSVAVLPDERTLPAAKARIRALGTLLDRTQAAEALVAKIDADMVGITRPATPPRVLFVYVTGNGTVQIAGRETAADTMIGLAGGVNASTGWTGYRPVTAEGVIAARPDVILASDRALASMGGPDGMWAQPGMAATPAGERRWLLAYDDLFLLGFGPRVGHAARDLASALAKGP
jgi:iron complex transport system substrate-binding protein